MALTVFSFSTHFISGAAYAWEFGSSTDHISKSEKLKIKKINR